MSGKWPRGVFDMSFNPLFEILRDVNVLVARMQCVLSILFLRFRPWLAGMVAESLSFQSSF